MKDNRIYLIHIRDGIQRIETNELSAKFKASGRSNFPADLDLRSGPPSSVDLLNQWAEEETVILRVLES